MAQAQPDFAFVPEPLRYRARAGAARAGWLKVSKVEARSEATEMGGPRVVVEYDLDEPSISPERPMANGGWWRTAPRRHQVPVMPWKTVR